MHRFYPILTLGLFLVSGFLPFQIKASHVAGADITYKCIGPNQYEVTLNIYKDVAGIPLVVPQSILYASNACNVNSSLNLVLIGGPFPIDPSIGCAGPPSLELEEYIFRGNLILPTCSGFGNDWILSWDWCCRNSAITNLNNPSVQDLYVETTLDNTLGNCNNSVAFNNQPTPVACLNQPFTYSLGAVDPDGDELAYSLVNCLEDNSDPVQYFGPFSGIFPLVGSPPAVIDPLTGILSFTPTINAVPVICVLVEEYRGGQKVGEVLRDIQIAIVDCGGANTPQISCFNGTDPSVPANCISSVCVNSQLCFSIQGSDLDGDNLTMSWNNGLPGSLFSVSGNGGNSPIASICWTPQSGEEGSHFFTIQLEDDACPVNLFEYRTFQVDVFGNANALSIDPTGGICPGGNTIINSNPVGTVSQHVWSPATGLSAANVEDPVASPAVPTVYTLTTTFSDGCILSESVFLDVFSSPTLSVDPAVSFACAASPVTLTATASSGAGISNYEWSNGISGSGASSISVGPGSSQSFSLTVTDGNGCTATASAFVNTSGSPDCPIIYAGPGVASGTGNGVASDPYNLQDAIAIGSCSGSTVRLLTGTYNLNQPLDIPNNVTLDGGFNSLGVKTSQPGATTLNRTSANPQTQNGFGHLIAVRANGASGFRLQDISITTDNAPAGTAISTYGIYLDGCSNYSIVRVQTQPGNAGSGSNGQPGTIGANGLMGLSGGGGDCDGTNCNFGGGVAGGIGGLGGTAGGGTPPGYPGQNGTGRNGGGGGNGGMGSDECTSNNGAGGCGGGSASLGPNCTGGGPGFNGDPGGDGFDGANGIDGLTPTGTPASGTAGSVVNGFWSPGGQGLAGAPGTGGQGGRGGGGGGRQTCPLCDDGPGNGGGGGGGGGQGGSGGTGGFGGGASFGIFLNLNGVNGEILQSRALSGASGPGGSGGQGGPGAPGGIGGLGGTVDCGTAVCHDVGCGGDGGNGGIGGVGQTGGSGQTGLSEALRIQSGAGLNQTQINFNLPGQAVITWDGTACTNTNVFFTGPGVTSPQQFPTTNGSNREDIVGTSGVYEDFIDIASDNFDPDGIANNGFVSDDMYRICEGESLDFSALNGGNGYLYNWTFIEPVGVNDLAADISGDPLASSVTGLTFNVAGIYQVRLQYQTICCGLSAEDIITVQVDPSPVLNIANATLCAEDQDGIVLSAGGTTAFGEAFPGGMPDNWAYTWAPSSGLSATSGESVIALPASTTVYTLTAINSSGTCMVSTQFTVQVEELLVTVTNPVPDACNNGGILQATPPGPVNFFTYNWADANGTPIGNAVAVVGLAGGNYSLTVTRISTGCTFVSGAVVQNLGVAGFVQNINAPTCPLYTDGSATVAATGAINYGYLWPASAGSQTTALATNLNPGNYAVTITDLNNISCQDIVSVTIPQPPILEAAFADIVHVNCPQDGSVKAIGESGSGSYLFAWDTGASTDLITGLTAGVYSVTVTDSQNLSCTATASHTVLDNSIINSVAPGTGVSNELNFLEPCACANVAVNNGLPFIQTVNNDCYPPGSIISALVSKPTEGQGGISIDLTKAPCIGSLDLSQNPVYYTVVTDMDGLNSETLNIIIHAPVSGNITAYQAALYGPVNPTNPQLSGGTFLDCNSTNIPSMGLKLKLDGTVSDGQAFIVIVDSDGTGTFDIEGAATSSALPIELVSFTGKVLHNESHFLEWITATESQTDFFQVERSTDGFEFEKFGNRVQAAGSSETVRHYEMLDANPVYGLNYYRLKVVHLDGESQYSEVITLKRNGEARFDFSDISPNPTSGLVSVHFFSAEYAPVHYELIDALGRKVLDGQVDSDKGMNKLDLDLKLLANGVYLIRLEQNRVKLTAKLVKTY